MNTLYHLATYYIYQQIKHAHFIANNYIFILIKIYDTDILSRVHYIKKVLR